MGEGGPTHDELEFSDAELLTQLLTHVGFAVWQAAECEDALAHYIVLRLREARGVGVARGIALLAKEQSRTFGQLLRELRDAEVLAPELESRLSTLVDERNWLVHRAKRENRGVLHDLEKYHGLLSRIDAMRREATELQRVLQGELERVAVAAGVDPKTIDQEAAALAAAWGY